MYTLKEMPLLYYTLLSRYVPFFSLSCVHGIFLLAQIQRPSSSSASFSNVLKVQFWLFRSSTDALIE